MHYCRKGGCNTSSYHTKNCRYWRSDGSYAAGYISTDTGLKGTSCQVNGDDAGVYGAYVANCNDGTGFITTSLEWVE